jgi:hypothetical protein
MRGGNAGLARGAKSSAGARFSVTVRINRSFRNAIDDIPTTRGPRSRTGSTAAATSSKPRINPRLRHPA